MKTREIEECISNFLKDILIANNEEVKRHRFVLLLEQLFGAMPMAKPTIEEFIFGAEHKIRNISRRGKKSDLGRADNQYRSVITEFEYDLNRTGNHAKQQLADYLVGNWNTGINYNFTLIASDFINWKIYSPNISQISQKKSFSSEEILLIERDSFTLSAHNKMDFYYFLDTVLFRLEKKKPTLENIQRDFGDGSNALISFLNVMSEYWDQNAGNSDAQVAFEQWQRFLSIAYGNFSASNHVFLVHTYLSVFAKILTYEVITNDDFIDDRELRSILNGDIFIAHNIQNFTDNDFFAWITDEKAIASLTPAFRAITAELENYDFTSIEEDIFKGVYQNLIDRDTRQSLGEYYTPDWLCEIITENLDISEADKFLDPSCGSGSFLRVIAKKLNKTYPKLAADDITRQVCGLDVHPLSVQISKATLVLAIKDRIETAKKPVVLNVYLANTLFTPASSVSLDLFGNVFNVWVDKKRISINTRIFDSPDIFEEAVKHAEKLAERSAGSPAMPLQQFEESLKNTIKALDIKLFGASIYQLYIAFKEAKENGRDSIWEFIVRNLYKPCFFHQSFDFVVGNPPWFTYSSISNSEYQEQIKNLAKNTNIWPKNGANAPHMEIAAVFLAHCNEYFLKNNGKLAFVLPRSVFSADHHHNIRTGQIQFLKIEEFWDLGTVEPLFNIPSCVVFSTRTKNNLISERKIPASGRKGRVFSGKLRKQNLTLPMASEQLTHHETLFHLVELGNATAISTHKIKHGNKINYYRNSFKQGATITPRNFYFVDLLNKRQKPWEAEIMPVSVHHETLKNAKDPWKGFVQNGQINKEFLFHTALAQNILPFALSKPPICLLPLQKLDDGKLRLMSTEEMINNGFLDTANWFDSVQEFWNKNRTQKSEQLSYLGRLDYNKGATSQNLGDEFVVIYNASGKDANSVVVRRSSYKIPFLFDHKAYLFTTANELEAYYVAAFLNSGYPNRVMKPFQSHGAFGARDVHKTILHVGLDQFDSNHPVHMRIAKISMECHSQAQQYLEDSKLPEFMNKNELGRHRLSLRKILSDQIGLIDQLFERDSPE